MRKRLSPSKSKVNAELAQRQNQYRIPVSKSTEFQKYFCHYNDAVYMGGMSAYKKHGKGILLHDDGSCVITDYLHDTPTGHNIIFRDNSITSIAYSSPYEFEISYKASNYIINIPFADGNEQPHGSGILIDYLNHRIYQLQYKKGVLVSKILHLDMKDNVEAFNTNNITKIVGVKHESAFSLTFEKPYKVHVKSQRNKTTIGYYEDDGELNGLGFTFYGQNLTANGEGALYLKSIERGLYRNSLLQTFGDKIFSNGNKYIGQFQKGEFSGYGILISPEQMKWVFGKFFKGQLSSIQDSNYKQFSESQFRVWSQNLRVMHRRFHERWIDQDIILPDEIYIYNLLKEALSRQMTHIYPDQVSLQNQDKQKLSRIQSQFEKGPPGSLINSKVEKELDNHYRSKTPKGPIKIEEIAPFLVAKNPETPIHRFDTEYSRRSTPKSLQKSYKMEDPFKINLIKVPETQELPDVNRYIQREYLKRQPRAPLNRNLEESREPIEQPIRYQYPTTIERSKYKYLYDEPTQYINPIIEELKQSRERLSRERERSLSKGRDNFERYPSSAYTSGYKVSNYPERYVGKITNKRHFDYDVNQQLLQTEPYESKYPTTAKYFPSSQDYIYPKERSQSPSGLYPSSKLTGRLNATPEDELYSQRKKYLQMSPQRGEGSKNFVVNNYKYWS